MTGTPRIHVLTGGPHHPVAQQFASVQEWLGDRAAVVARDGATVFDELEECHLFVGAGLHWTGLADAALQDADSAWADGVARCAYRPPTEQQKQAFADYVSSGRPVLAWHGGTGSFDDWPDYGRLLGFRWIWGTTAHSAYGTWQVRVERTGHRVLAGVDDYRIDDELYYDVEVAPDLATEVHAVAEYEGRRLPLIVTGEGGRTPGAGRTAFLANGHDMAAFESPEFRKVVVNTIGWLLDG